MQPDLDLILAALARSKFRSRFPLGARESAYLQEKGLEAVLQHAATFITQRLAAAGPHNDGKQTPMRGHPVFVAQHATATCCRGCLAKWHSIQAGKPLNPDEQQYIIEVLKRWLEQQGGALSVAPTQPSLF